MCLFTHGYSCSVTTYLKRHEKSSCSWKVMTDSKKNKKYMKSQKAWSPCSCFWEYVFYYCRWDTNLFTLQFVHWWLITCVWCARGLFVCPFMFMSCVLRPCGCPGCFVVSNSVEILFCLVTFACVYLRVYTFRVLLWDAPLEWFIKRIVFLS